MFIPINTGLCASTVVVRIFFLLATRENDSTAGAKEAVGDKAQEDGEEYDHDTVNKGMGGFKDMPPPITVKLLKWLSQTNITIIGFSV